MSRPRLERQPRFAHAARVAAVATLLIAVLYVVLTVTFDLVDSSRLVAQVDAHLRERLTDATYHGDLFARPGGIDDDHELDAAPVVLWRVNSAGKTVALTDGAPTLPAGTWSSDGQPTTASLVNGSFRLLAIRVSGKWLVAGQSLADTEHVADVLGAAEVIAGPVLVVAMFLGALVIGLKASGPIEQARRRQLEFAADASHELRTPLSVIEAEVGLALGGTPGMQRANEAPRYRDALERIRRESDRLRRIVEDLLWLARFDSEPPPPGEEPVDLATIAEGCADRFSGIARSREIDLSVSHEGDEHAWIKAPPEWIDRLSGVLVDNACRYAGPGGTVRITVTTLANRVSLSVDDSGPGIPLVERPWLFDRFHRAADEGSGAGLGLAIADAVVRSTDARWRVGDSSDGGAQMEVSWHRAQLREGSQPPGTAPKDDDVEPSTHTDAPEATNTRRDTQASGAERA